MKVLTLNTPPSNEDRERRLLFVSAHNCMQIKHREMSINAKKQHKEIEFSCGWSDEITRRQQNREINDKHDANVDQDLCSDSKNLQL